MQTLLLKCPIGFKRSYSRSTPHTHLVCNLKIPPYTIPFVICGEGMGFIVAWKSVRVCVGGGGGGGGGGGQRDSTGAVVM